MQDPKSDKELFKVLFSVVVRIQISTASGDHHGTQEDVELIQEVGMLPKGAPYGGLRPAPRYLETGQLQDLQQALTSQLNGLDLQRKGPILDLQEEEEEEEEEEYDGYKCISAMVGQDGPAPPTIDEDESPPPAPDTPPEGLELHQSPILVQPSDSTNNTFYLIFINYIQSTPVIYTPDSFLGL
ncbi:hypothetical protein H4Q26_008954 [Puccinia striiformis f. sp. tritici PST-130]|nr:hypothetical protein H4Q26_008954 [Puccinia striiformis f. sp. tritici PST-130]